MSISKPATVVPMITQSKALGFAKLDVAGYGRKSARTLVELIPSSRYSAMLMPRCDRR